MAENDEGDGPSRRRALAALAVIAVLLAATAYVGNRLRDAARLQDCVAAGRSHCAPIPAPRR